MHWFNTGSKGKTLNAGKRPGGNSANGNAVMFDTGKILTCGGSEAFAKESYPATTVRPRTHARLTCMLTHARGTPGHAGLLYPCGSPHWSVPALCLAFALHPRV
jgi:hypothetical protein